jgi:polysaccharide pyruvyl transferase WcaK-like protein
MTDTLHILVADYVPLANKGEEAIVRGMEDLLSDGRPVALGLFDNVPNVEQRDNITVFPKDWVFRFEGNARLSGTNRILLQACIAAQLRVGAYGPLKNLTPAGTELTRPLQKFFRRAEYVLVGHDGVFGVESCGIVHLAKKHGKRTGILGASAGIGSGRLYKAWLYRRTMDESDFCVFREKASRESMRQVCRDPEKLYVAPDPAFAMQPVVAQKACEILEQHESYRRAKDEGRPVVAVTALEKGRVYAGFRPDLQGAAKQQAHAEYLATVLDSLVNKHRAFVLFLPHSVEESGNDIVAAEHVVEQMKAQPADCMILEQDCGARMLKGIIRECDFLVGERTHSLIGSVSVETPFVGLTNRRDTRTHGIVGDMCRCEEQVIDMDITSAEDTSARVLESFERRAVVREHLVQVQGELSKQIEDLSRMVKGLPGSTR